MPATIQHSAGANGAATNKALVAEATKGDVSIAQLDLKKVPQLVGTSARARIAQVSTILDHTRWPVFGVGPSGTGKTAVLMNAVKRYALTHKVPAYYLCLSPEQTKTSIVLGLRMINGTITPVKGVVARAMAEGGIVFIDEATHSTQELLLMLNSLMDRTAVTSIGDEIVYAADTFRIVFASNRANYAGNVALPQAFAQRVVALNFDYPDFEDECKIAQFVAQQEYDGPYDVPESVARYLTSFVRETRSDTYPLSARNIAIALILACIAPKAEGTALDKYFVSNQSGTESARRNIAKKILGHDVGGLDDLQNPAVTSFLQYVSAIGVEAFRELVLSATMYYLSVEGMEMKSDVKRTQLAASVI